MKNPPSPGEGASVDLLPRLQALLEDAERAHLDSTAAALQLALVVLEVDLGGLPAPKEPGQ